VGTGDRRLAGSLQNRSGFLAAYMVRRRDKSWRAPLSPEVGLAAAAGLEAAVIAGPLVSRGGIRCGRRWRVLVGRSVWLAFTVTRASVLTAVAERDRMLLILGQPFGRSQGNFPPVRG